MIKIKPDPEPERPKPREVPKPEAPKGEVPIAPGPAVGKAVAQDAKSERLIFPASPDLVQRLDDEWHRRKLKSRAETIRVLLEEALKG